jgi:23S rRNA pseudouridine2605 synthase
VSPASDEGERLQKVLAATGYGSRRVCEELIDKGRVTVNGEVATLGKRVNAESDHIEVDGAPVAAKAGLVHYLLNKPAGVVTTADDPQGRETVVMLVPDEPRVFSVGRLDADSEGLLILTNDGELTHRLTHPSYGVEKEYLVNVDGDPPERVINKLRKGVELDDGVTSPAKVTKLSPGVLRMTIHEGRNRQIRRMCETVGFPVVRLVRTRIGPIFDPALKPGKWRQLSQEEVRKLAEATTLNR